MYNIYIYYISWFFQAISWIISLHPALAARCCRLKSQRLIICRSTCHGNPALTIMVAMVTQSLSCWNMTELMASTKKKKLAENKMIPISHQSKDCILEKKSNPSSPGRNHEGAGHCWLGAYFLKKSHLSSTLKQQKGHGPLLGGGHRCGSLPPANTAKPFHPEEWETGVDLRF